jgi:hypothetical protein
LKQQIKRNNKKQQKHKKIKANYESCTGKTIIVAKATTTIYEKTT